MDDKQSAECKALEDALASTKRELQDRTTSMDALKTQLELTRDELAKAGQRESKHYSALMALQAEIRSLRVQFEEAKRDMIDSKAADSARQAQVALPRGELTAARDVGRAALASLRVIPAPIPSPSRNGWMTVMLRRLGLSTSYSLVSVE